jgi:putative transposase
MSRALSPSISRRYGLARVARVWNVSRAGVYRFRSEPSSG